MFALISRRFLVRSSLTFAMTNRMTFGSSSRLLRAGGNEDKPNEQRESFEELKKRIDKKLADNEISKKLAKGEIPTAKDLWKWVNEVKETAEGTKRTDDVNERMKVDAKRDEKSSSSSSSGGSGGSGGGGGGGDKKKSSSDDDGEAPFWRKPGFRFGFWTIGLPVFLIVILPLLSDVRPANEVTFNDFLVQYVPSGRVKLVTVDDVSHRAQAFDENNVRLCDFTVPSAAALDAALLEAVAGDVRRTPDVMPRNLNPSRRLLSLLPTLLIIGATLYSVRMLRGVGRSLFAIGQTNFRVAPENVSVRFADVAGLDEAKLEVTEFVEFLRRPAKFRRLGARIPRGALLVGPPGTGKTLLAKATAGEAQVPFFSMAGSDFTEMFVGVGPARVRDLFKQARESAPCIIFLDEIDAVGRARSSQKFTNDERESTLNQLLVELDGFDAHSGIVVLAGTNRPDVLDKALLRPGRFDRTITVDLPDIRGRKQIFDIHLKRITVQIDRSALAETLAALTPGFSGADISNVCNEAALIAARGRATVVEMTHFEQAVERVVAGLAKQNRVLSEIERRIVAVHESGHAIVGYFLQHCDPLLKVSIVPRGAGALGYAMYQPLERAVTSREEMADRMSMTLAGRAAEELVFGRISTGAADDLDKVTKLAYYQVTSGLNDRIGPLAFQPADPGDIFQRRQYSEATAMVIDAEVRKLVASAYDRAREVLANKRELVERLSKRLLEAEQLVFADLQEILGPRPFAERRLYSEIVADDARRQRDAPSPSTHPGTVTSTDAETPH